MRERWLWTAVLKGDGEAWRVLYQDCFEGLAAYVAWRSGGRKELIEDAVQETWLTAVRRIASFDPGRGSFAAWLRGIAANVIRNRIRDEDRRSRAAERLVRARGIEPSPDPGLDGPDRAERTARALSGLPERYEEVLRAKYLERRTVAEIASALRESQKAIESALSRAREAFREAYLKLERDEHGA